MAKFLTPPNVPEEVVCRTIRVPNSLDWFGIFNAALLATIYEYNWSHDIPENLTPAEAAAAARVIVFEYLDASMTCDPCELPNGNFVSRLGEFGAWQMLEGGAWTAPSGDYAIPAYTARTEPTADERKCLAAKNAANVLEQFYEELSDAFSIGLPIAEAVLGFGVAIGIAIAPPLGLLAAAALEIGLIFFAELFAALEFITADTWTSGVTDMVVCTLLANATDAAGVVTFDYPQVWQDIQLVTFGEGLSPEEILLSGQILYMLNFIGAEGLNLAGETTAISDSDCSDCETGWCYEFDFRASDGGWAADTYGVWTSGEGWQSQLAAGTTPALLVGKSLDFANSLRDVLIEYSQADGVLMQGRLYYHSGGYNAITGIFETINGSDLETYIMQDNTTIDIPNIWFNVSESTPPTSGLFTLHRILFRGDFGSNPFGTDNCE